MKIRNVIMNALKIFDDNGVSGFNIIRHYNGIIAYNAYNDESCYRLQTEQEITNFSKVANYYNLMDRLCKLEQTDEVNQLVDKITLAIAKIDQQSIGSLMELKFQTTKMEKIYGKN